MRANPVICGIYGCSSTLIQEITAIMLPSIENITSATLTTGSQIMCREVNELVSLHIESEWVTVLVIDLPVMGYHPEDAQTRNCVAVQLIEAGLVTLPEVVIGIDIPRSTVRDARQRFQEQGVRGLVPAKSGPKEAWKLITRARRLVLDIVYEHPEWKMPQIADHVNQRLQEEGLVSLSERHMRRFLTFCGVLPRYESIDLNTKATNIDELVETETLLLGGEIDRVKVDEIGQCDALAEQNTLVLPNEQEVASDKEDIQKLVRPHLSIVDTAPHLQLGTECSPQDKFPQDNSSGEVDQPHTTQPTSPSLTVADRRYLARLRAGIDTAFGGGFLIVPFLMLIQFPLLITCGTGSVGWEFSRWNVLHSKDVLQGKPLADNTHCNSWDLFGREVRSNEIHRTLKALFLTVKSNFRPWSDFMSKTRVTTAKSIVTSRNRSI